MGPFERRRPTSRLSSTHADDDDGARRGASWAGAYKDRGAHVGTRQGQIRRRRLGIETGWLVDRQSFDRAAGGWRLRLRRRPGARTAGPVTIDGGRQRQSVRPRRRRLRQERRTDSGGLTRTGSVGSDWMLLLLDGDDDGGSDSSTTTRTGGIWNPPPDWLDDGADRTCSIWSSIDPGSGPDLTCCCCCLLLLRRRRVSISGKLPRSFRTGRNNRQQVVASRQDC